jgi:hypothetical protein
LQPTTAFSCLLARSTPSPRPPPHLPTYPVTRCNLRIPQRRFDLGKLKDEDFPKFKLFLKGADPKQPLDYAGKVDKDEMAAWLVAHTSLFIGKRVGLRCGAAARA